jgi:hypothetical protein
MRDDEVADWLFEKVTEWSLSSYKVKKRLVINTIPDIISGGPSGIVREFVAFGVRTDLSWWEEYSNARWYVGSHLEEIDCLGVTERILEEL